MIGNILKKPDEAKFRRINLANAAFTKRVGAVPGGITFLTAVGYVKDDGENALVLDADCDLEIVRQGDAELGGYIAKMAPTSLSTAGAAAGGHLGSSSYGVEGGAVTSGAAPGGLLNTTGGVAVEQDTNIEDGGLDYLAWLRMAGGDVFMNSDGGLFEEEAQAPPH